MIDDDDKKNTGYSLLGNKSQVALTTDSQVVTVRIGSAVQLNCIITGHRNGTQWVADDLFWARGNKRLTSNTRVLNNRTLQLSINSTSWNDAGKYWCILSADPPKLSLKVSVIVGGELIEGAFRFDNEYDFLETFRFDYKYEFDGEYHLETFKFDYKYEFDYEYDFLETFRFDYEYEFDYEYDFLKTFRFDYEYEFDYAEYDFFETFRLDYKYQFDYEYDFLETFRFDYEYEFGYEYDFLETFRFDYEYEFDYEYDFLETFRFDYEYEFDYAEYDFFETFSFDYECNVLVQLSFQYRFRVKSCGRRSVYYENRCTFRVQNLRRST